MAENNSKDLLQLEDNTTTIPSTSSLESKLFVCRKESTLSPSKTPPVERPPMLPLPKSQVLGKVKDFLGVFSESNKKLMQDAKENPDQYDIEVLSGKESEFIEMDLMLGVADLHTPEAIAAAETAIAGYQPVIPLAESSSGSESEDSSDDDNDDEDNEAGSKSKKLGSKDSERDSLSQKSSKKNPRKRSKIVELS